MSKPTIQELINQTSRGGRVFLFEYPNNDLTDDGKGCHMPTFAAQEKIEDALLKLPGCKEVNGPLVNGIIAITIDDAEDGANKITDAQFCEKIASAFHRFWRE